MPSKKPAAPKQPATRAAAAKPATRTAATRTRKAEASPIRPLTHDEIALRAHDLYVRSGFQGHREVEFWLEAERQLKDGIKV